MKQSIAPAVIKTALTVDAQCHQYSPLRSISIDIQNADKYAKQLADIYSGSVHAALMEHDPKAAVRISTLFAELCSTTGHAEMRIHRISNQLAQGGAL